MSVKIKKGVCDNCHHDLYRCDPPNQCFHHMGSGCGESGQKTSCNCSKPEIVPFADGALPPKIQL